MSDLSDAVSRVHFHIDEMREDGISDRAILAALGQATAEIARTICANDQGALCDISELTATMIKGDLPL